MALFQWRGSRRRARNTAFSFVLVTNRSWILGENEIRMARVLQPSAKSPKGWTTCEKSKRLPQTGRRLSHRFGFNESFVWSSFRPKSSLYECLSQTSVDDVDNLAGKRCPCTRRREFPEQCDDQPAGSPRARY